MLHMTVWNVDLAVDGRWAANGAGHRLATRQCRVSHSHSPRLPFLPLETNTWHRYNATHQGALPPALATQHSAQSRHLKDHTLCHTYDAHQLAQLLQSSQPSTSFWPCTPARVQALHAWPEAVKPHPVKRHSPCCCYCYLHPCCCLYTAAAATTPAWQGPRTASAAPSWAPPTA